METVMSLPRQFTHIFLSKMSIHQKCAINLSQRIVEMRYITWTKGMHYSESGQWISIHMMTWFFRRQLRCERSYLSINYNRSWSNSPDLSGGLALAAGSLQRCIDFCYCGLFHCSQPQNLWESLSNEDKVTISKSNLQRDAMLRGNIAELGDESLRGGGGMRFYEHSSKRIFRTVFR